jgi:DNA-binding response OmpR family regulator
MRGEGRVPRATVLVVEDDPSARRSLVEALEREGHVAVEAHNGIEGLQLLQEVEPDLVLLGVEMPRLDGFGVLAAMQDLPSVSRTPVVMVVGTGDLAAALRCVEMGATDFVPHPIDPVLLRARVNAALEPDRSPS